MSAAQAKTLLQITIIVSGLCTNNFLSPIHSIMPYCEELLKYCI